MKNRLMKKGERRISVKNLAKLTLLKKYIKPVEQLEQDTQNCEQAQKRVLLSKLRKNTETKYGRKYNFSNISTVKEFQQEVPIIDFSDISYYIEQIKNGEPRILTSQQPIGFVTSSGTTDKPKFIPVTKDSLNEYIDSWNVWIRQIIQNHPRIILGKALSITSPSIEGHTQAGIPYGSMTGLTVNSQLFLSRKFYALSKQVFEIKDTKKRQYAILRLGLEKNISIINTANPSTIKRMCLTGDKLKQQLIKEIYDGTISIKLTSITTKPNKKRAKQLEVIVETTGHLFPKYYWPNLELIGCWTGGTLSLYLDSFPEFFGQTAIRDLGLLASEGRFSIPISDNSSEGILNISSNFYEFISESEIESDNPTILTADNLEKGKYFMLVTTSSGLYRYNMHDLIEVTGHYNQAPIIRFLNKGEHISSLTGEKITENQVINAMRMISEKDTQHKTIDTFIVAPVWNETPHYALILEDSGQNKQYLRELANNFDAHLRKLNMEYDCKRRDRLNTTRIALVPKGEFEKIQQEFLKDSPKDTQYKHKFLNSDLQTFNNLKAKLI